MPYGIGVVLALATCFFATLIRLDRDRAFYPTLTIVIATYYALFATMARSVDALIAESIGIAIFIAAAVTGFKRSLILVAAALIAHGFYDLVHDRIITNPGVPLWWPAFCSAYDVVAGVYLLIVRRTIRESAA